MRSEAIQHPITINRKIPITGVKMKRQLHPCVYILTNKTNHVLYTGVSSNIFKRVSEHKNKVVAGFTSSYNFTKLVYYEEYATMEEAIAREKQIKGGSRKKKIELINSKNL
jgi:putative endonuclease